MYVRVCICVYVYIYIYEILVCVCLHLLHMPAVREVLLSLAPNPTKSNSTISLFLMDLCSETENQDRSICI